MGMRHDIENIVVNPTKVVVISFKNCCHKKSAPKGTCTL